MHTDPPDADQVDLPGPDSAAAPEESSRVDGTDEAALLPKSDGNVMSRNSTSLDGRSSKITFSDGGSSWPACIGLILVLLIVSGYIAVVGMYSGGNSSTSRHGKRAQPFNAEGLVTGATHPESLRPKYEDLPKISVTTYGAASDASVETNTGAFQRAIHAASDIGGGIVVVESGRYVIGSIDLLSDTYLYIQDSAVVIGSSNEQDYPYPDSWESAASESRPTSSLQEVPVLIRCKEQDRVGIFGHGILDGGAVPNYVDGYRTDWDKLVPVTFRNETCLGECRPRMVMMEHCHEVVVQDVTLQNSPDWTLHVRGCSEVLIQNVQIHGDHRWPNNDGIDIDSSINVSVRNNTIVTADDAICVKSSARYGPTANILIQNNIVESRSSAFKIGSATVEDIYNVLVDQLYIMSGSNRALGIQHRDGGNVYNIHFRHVIVGGTMFQTEGWWGNAEPIYISTLPRHRNGAVGNVSNITFQDFKAYDVANGVLWSSIRGGNPLVNISFINSHILLVQYPRQWNFERGRLPSQIAVGVNYSSPQRDYRPTDLEPNLVPVTGKVDAFFLEGVDMRSTMCRDSSVTFVKGAGSDSGHDWWGDCLGGQGSGKTGPFRGLKCVFGGSPF